MTAHYQHYVHVILAIPRWVPIICLALLFIIVIVLGILERRKP